MLHSYRRSLDVAQQKSVMATDSYFVQGRLGTTPLRRAPPTKSIAFSKKEIVMSTLVSQTLLGLSGERGCIWESRSSQ